MTASDSAEGYPWPRTDAELTAFLHNLLFEPLGGEAQRSAADDVLDMPRLVPEACWRMIELAAAMDLTEFQACLLAAGPLEDLLGYHGEQFIERVETATRRESGMRTIVAGVWKGIMPAPIWARFLAMRERLGIEPL